MDQQGLIGADFAIPRVYVYCIGNRGIFIFGHLTGCGDLIRLGHAEELDMTYVGEGIRQNG